MLGRHKASPYSFKDIPFHKQPLGKFPVTSAAANKGLQDEAGRDSATQKLGCPDKNKK
jgi:hypothetical protein